MTVTYTIIPFEIERRQELEAWIGFPITDATHLGCFPTLDELKASLEAVKQSVGVSIEYLQGTTQWEARIHHDDTYSAVETNFVQQNNQRLPFSFRGDGAFLIEIIKNLPARCGTFLVLTNGESPELITASG